jgi:hypothetical protein
MKKRKGLRAMTAEKRKAIAAKGGKAKAAKNLAEKLAEHFRQNNQFVKG